MICVSISLIGTSAEWTPRPDQILGRISLPIVPAPLRFEVDLPIAPSCESVDLDNNEKKDSGVKVFAAIVATNIFGDSYLEQLEQESGFTSVSTDPKTQSVSSGFLLIYSPNDDQGVPSGFGTDGKLFTNDDPTIKIPAGYSLMNIDKGRKITFDRSEVLKMEIPQL